MATPALRTLLAAALAAALLVGCAPSTPTGRPAAKPAPQSSPAIGRIVFDMGHGEIFGAEDTSQLGQSEAVNRMKRAGFDVVVNQAPIDAALLADASGLVLAGPMRPLQDVEHVAINDFVNRGGVVLLTIHVPFPVHAVPARYGLPIKPSLVIRSERPLEGQDDPGVFLADKIAPSPLTEGVRSICVISGWPVQRESDTAEVLVSTGEDGWLDADANRSRSDTERADVGVIGATRIGKGYVVVSGDDAVFANIAIGRADNAKLLDNILEFISRKQDV